MAYERKDGQGSLSPNEKQNDRQPDYKGYLQLNGKQYEVALWKRTSQKGAEYLSIQATEKTDTAPQASSVPKQAEPEEDMPF